MKLTKTSVKTISPPEEGTADWRRKYRIVWDDELRGFGLVVTNWGTKSFIVRARVHGQERRHTLGRVTVLSADKARELAKAWLWRIAAGHDPVAEKRISQVLGVPLRQVLDRYKESVKAAHTKRSIASSYKHFTGWLVLPLSRIDGDMVKRRYAEASMRTPGAATVAFRYFRAAWNLERKANKDQSGEYLLPPCPTLALSDAKRWNSHPRRQRAIHPHQMRDWFAAVDALPDPVARGFFRFLMMTGCRRDEAARLTWTDTDLTGRSVRFRETKAGRDHHLPLPDQLTAQLLDLKSRAIGTHVFGNAYGEYRGRESFQAEISRLRKSYGEYSPHDCRRTFISIAEIIGIPSITTKKLVNHSTAKDVTGGYVCATVEGLRGPIQRIADQIEAYCISGANVVPLRGKLNPPD